MKNAIGLIETTSIARGIETADAMIKAADVKLYLARTVCPGKYIILVGGDVDAVNSSVERGKEVAREYMADTVLIPNLHDDIFPAIEGVAEVPNLGERWALGAIETFSVTSCILAADAAVKASNIILLDIRPAVGLGGKSFTTMIGEVSAVESAVNAGKEKIEKEGLLVTFTLIPNITKELLSELI
jgi:microcompartment protein CcmL/EutN